MTNVSQGYGELRGDGAYLGGASYRFVSRIVGSLWAETPVLNRAVASATLVLRITDGTEFRLKLGHCGRGSAEFGIV
jgi:hypothetical protein